MKKRIIVTALLLFIGYFLYQVYVFVLAPTQNLKRIYLVPKDAVMVIETQKPIDNWQKISTSSIWKHLQKNNYFKELTKSLNGVDHIFNKQKTLINLIGNRDLLISIHVTQKKQYDLLFIADLQKMAKLNFLKKYLSSFIGTDYKLTKRKYHEHEILEFYNLKNRETLNISFIENQLIASFTHTLVEHAIDQYNEPIIGRDLAFIDNSKKVGYDHLFRLYVQYKYMNSYLNCFFDQTDDLVKEMNKVLNYSGFNFDLKSNNFIVANGFTNTNDDASIYLKALQKSGKGKRSIAIIAPKRTALYLSFAFDSFNKFYKNFEDVQKENPSQFKTYQDNIDKVENYLDIDIKKQFISWIDDEIALLQMQPSKTLKNEMALVFKINNKKNAEKNLNFIIEKIRKKTPVKFKDINYKNHKINYMSIKGFFKMLLGNMFDKFDKPYFTLIENYIIFSNDPNTLKNIIDDYLGKETLSKSEDYQKFNTSFKTKSSIFTYINTPILYKNIYVLADKKTKKQLINNKDYIICFPQIGFQLTPYINMFKSKLIVSFQDPDIVKSKEQFKDKLIGPRQDNSSNNLTTTNITKNILEIEKVNLFKVITINPSDLDSDEYIEKYKNGKIKIKVDIEDGVPHGRYKTYFPNGELKLKGKFNKGKQIKTWKAYDSNGNFLGKKSF